MAQESSTQSGRRRRRKAGFAVLGGGLLLILLAVLVATAPSFLFPETDLNDSTPDPEPTAAEVALPEERGVYVEGDVGFPATLNPLLAQSMSERTVSSLLFRGLFRNSPSGDPLPDLATGWADSEDGRNYEVTIESDLTWHDGEPFRVEDVLFTISLVQDPEFPGDATLSRFWRGITVQKIDDYVLTFELMEPYAGFLHYLTLPILPKHIFSGTLPFDLHEPEIAWSDVGIGQYSLTTVDSDASELRFQARVGDGFETNVEEIIIRYFESRDEALEAFRDGDVDGLSFVPIDALADDHLFPDGTKVLAPSLAGYTALYFNLRHPTFRDVQTRQAIELAIDREELVERVFAGHALPGSSPIPRMLSAHDPGDHGGHDPDRARQLLDQTGWTLEARDSVRVRGSERFVIPVLVNADDPQRMAVAQVLQEQLQQVGILLEIQGRSLAEVQQSVNERQFTAALFGWHTETGDPDCFQMWHSSQAEVGMNFSGFADADADEALVAARRSVDVDDRNEHYAEFQRIFAEQVPAVVLFYPRYHFAVSARVEGAEPESLVHPSDRVRQISGWSVRASSD